MSLKKHQEAKRANFEREVIAVASEEFATRGFEDFSLRRLAKKMGCAVGTLYLYFDDKSDVLHAVVEASFRQLFEVLQSLPPARNPKELLQSAFRAYVEFGLKYPHHYRCAFALPGIVKPREYRPHAAFDFLREKVRLGAEVGLFAPDDVEVQSQIIWTAVHGLTSLLIARPDFPWAPREKLIETLSETVLTGMAARGRRSSRSRRAGAPL